MPLILPLVFIAACSTSQEESPIVINEQLPTIKVPDDYRTIIEAISTVKTPCNIYVRPGVYDESISLRSGITLIGLGKDRTETVIQPKEGSAVIKVSSARNVQISNLTVDARRRAKVGAQIKNSSIVLYDCVIKNASTTNLHIVNSKINIENSYIKTSAGAGIALHNVSGLVRNCDIIANRWGIIIYGNFDLREQLIFENNRIDRSRQDGVVFGYEQSNSNALFIRNRITRTSVCAVVINGTATPKFRGNYIAHNTNGISIGPAAQPDFGTKDNFGENTILDSVSGWRDENPVHMVGNYWGSRYGPPPRKISKGIRNFLIVQPYLKNPPGSAKQVLLFRDYSDK